jgi:hypothetical protein
MLRAMYSGKSGEAVLHDEPPHLKISSNATGDLKIKKNLAYPYFKPNL